MSQDYYFLKPVVQEYPSIVPTNRTKVIGRAESCDVLVDNHFLSFIHASIIKKNNEIVLIDLGSSNGTFVNDQKISRALLSKGDKVKFGSVRYELMRVEAKQEVKEKFQTTPPTTKQLLNDPEVVNNFSHQSNLDAESEDLSHLELDISKKDETNASIVKTALEEKVENSNIDETSLGEVNERPLEDLDTIDHNPFIRSKDKADSTRTLNEKAIMEDFFADEQERLDHEIKLREESDGRAILELFPEFAFTEFIFEEDVKRKSLNFADNRPSIETTMTFGNYIHDIDYTNSSYSTLNLTGDVEKKSNPKNKVMSVPLESFGLDKEIVSIKKDKFFLNEVSGLEYEVYDSDGRIEDPFEFDKKIAIEDDQVIKLNKDVMNLYLRKTRTPPKTIAPKWYEQDKFLFGLIAFIFILWSGLTALSISIGKVEIIKKDIPEEIDRILIRKKIRRTTTTRATTTTRRATTTRPPTTRPPRTTRPPTTRPPRTTRPQAAQPPPRPKPIPKPISKPIPKPIAPAPPRKVVTPVTIPQPPKISAAEKLKKANLGRMKKLQGKFTKLLNKVNNDSSAVSYDDTQNTDLSASSAGSISGANVGTVRANSAGIGDIGKAQGSFGTGSSINSGGKGFGSGGIGTVGNGTGTRTVLLGSLDPKLIQNILRQHMPQFGFCYEQELERISKKLGTTLEIKFTITGQGRVQSPNIRSQAFNLTSQGISCFNSVLLGIKFPKPKGGGIVKVKQPLNMEPKF